MTDQERLVFESLRSTSELAKQISAPARHSDDPDSSQKALDAHEEEPGHACRKQSTGKCCGGCRKP